MPLFNLARAAMILPLLVGTAAGNPGPGPVIWNSPSRDALDSMPLSGRRGAGANVWVQDGSIWLYLAHNGAYDDHGDLLKLGCVRITPGEMKLGGDHFSQTLDPATGTITIAEDGFSAALWFAGETLILESTHTAPLPLAVGYGIWRDTQRIEVDEHGLISSHRNADDPAAVAAMAARQGIAMAAVHDATTRRVFGGAMAIDGGVWEAAASKVAWQLWKGKAWTCKTAAKASHTIAIALGAEVNGQPVEWRKRATALLDPNVRKTARADELTRWERFWSRSHVTIAPAAPADDPGRLVGQNYQLFRYMLACNREGELPLLFNGGIFTVDVPYGRITGNTYTFKHREGQEDPDYRRWGQTHFMSQNQRWMGWPAVAGGDLDLLEPTLAFYRDRAATAACRAKTNGAEGVVYPEPMDIWGLCAVKPLPNGLCESKHLTYHFSMMLEIAWMALQARETLGRDVTKDLAWIEGTVLFYDSFYRARCKELTGREFGAGGKLVIYPSNALELLEKATNPVEVVCGLRRVTEGLLALPGLAAPRRERLVAIQGRLPDIPVGERDGRRSVLEAASFDTPYLNKSEPIEMFSFWPYRFFGITQPDTLQLARDTWDTVPKSRRRCIDTDWSWMANVVNVAALARPEESRRRAIFKLANNAAPQARFPAFFGPGHDWIPDHNWGGSGMTGLQEMLLAPQPGATGKLYLFPSWPADWDVSFSLHAPGPTLVECSYRRGKIESLKVTPESRAKDVVIWLGK